jgi:hypothetical protein
MGCLSRFERTSPLRYLAARRTSNLGWRKTPKPVSVLATFNPKIRAPDNLI